MAWLVCVASRGVASRQRRVASRRRRVAWRRRGIVAGVAWRRARGDVVVASVVVASAWLVAS
ncbi:hypothetical protein ACXZ9C_11435 [Streptococcus agalactiae]